MNGQTETVNKSALVKVDAVRFVIITVAYFITGRLGLEFAIVGSNISLIWLPTGIAVAALFRWGSQYCLAIWMGAFLVNTAIGTPALTASAISTGNTLAPLLTVALLRHWHFNPDISNWRDVPVFAVSGAIGMVLSALSGVTILKSTGVLAEGVETVAQLNFLREQGCDKYQGVHSQALKNC